MTNQQLTTTQTKKIAQLLAFFIITGALFLLVAIGQATANTPKTGSPAETNKFKECTIRAKNQHSVHKNVDVLISTDKSDSKWVLDNIEEEANKVTERKIRFFDEESIKYEITSNNEPGVLWVNTSFDIRKLSCTNIKTVIKPVDPIVKLSGKESPTQEPVEETSEPTPEITETPTTQIKEAEPATPVKGEPTFLG